MTKESLPQPPATQGHTQICTHIHTPLNYNDLIISLNLLYWIFSLHIILQHNTSIFQYGSLAYKQWVKSQHLQTNMSLYFVSFFPLPPTHHLPTHSLLYLVPFLPPINHNFYFLLLVYFNIYVWLLVVMCVLCLCLVPQMQQESTGLPETIEYCEPLDTYRCWKVNLSPLQE